MASSGKVMDSKAFLAHIREQLANVEAPDLPSGSVITPISGGDDGAALPSRFIQALEAAGGEGLLVGRPDLSEAVAEVARRGSPRTAVVGSDLADVYAEVQSGLQRVGVELLAATGSRELRLAAEETDLGITGALAAIASTGSILLSTSPTSSLLSLLPPTHIAIMSVAKLVPGSEELIGLLTRVCGRDSGAVLVTGPSRTADIELRLVQGVHGPGRVVVILIDEGPA